MGNFYAVIILLAGNAEGYNKKTRLIPRHSSQCASTRSSISSSATLRSPQVG